jgi:hypothetical protein
MSYVALNNPKWFGFDIAAALPKNKPPLFVNYMNADYRYLAAVDDFVGIHVVRDPRDIGLSAYFSHLYSHSTDWWPELADHRQRLEGLNFTDGLLADLAFTETLVTDGFPITVFPAMDQWNYHDPRIMEIKFETLVTSPLEVLSDAFGHLGLLSQDREPRLEILRELVEANAFEKLSGGRRVGRKDNQHHYRSGLAGEWRQHFEPPHRAWFKERYQGLLTQLSYESDSDW